MLEAITMDTSRKHGTLDGPRGNVFRVDHKSEARAKLHDFGQPKLFLPMLPSLTLFVNPLLIIIGYNTVVENEQTSKQHNLFFSVV